MDVSDTEDKVDDLVKNYDAHPIGDLAKDEANIAGTASKDYVVDPVADGVTTAAHAVGDDVAQPAVDGVVSAANTVGHGVRSAGASIADGAEQGFDTVKGWFGG